MGGYAEYVWSAFGLTVVVLLLNVYLARRNHRLAIERGRERLRSTQ
ncbi:MAG: heme exporter protein CcmD [Gammaproteobacteria bacterium]|nr:heme exporter protein CcmD [Gammaproteobacteria bacterium]